jgi:hypothetical protein
LWQVAAMLAAHLVGATQTTRRICRRVFFPKNPSVSYSFLGYASFAYILRGIKKFHIPFLAIVFKIQVWLRAGYKPACRFLKRSIFMHMVQETAFSKNDF